MFFRLFKHVDTQTKFKFLIFLPIYRTKVQIKAEQNSKKINKIITATAFVFNNRNMLLCVLSFIFVIGSFDFEYNGPSVLILFLYLETTVMKGTNYETSQCKVFLYNFLGYPGGLLLNFLAPQFFVYEMGIMKVATSCCKCTSKSI